MPRLLTLPLYIALGLALLSPSVGVPKRTGYLTHIAVLDGEPVWSVLKENKVQLCPEQQEVQASGLKESTIYRKHGTNIGLTVWSHISPENRPHTCLVFIPLFVKDHKGDGVFDVNGLYKLLAFKSDMANLSYSGGLPDLIEKELILQALSLGVEMNVAAGNEGTEHKKGKCLAYPACYKYDSQYSLNKNSHNFTVIGARGLVTSNKGDLVDVYEEACYPVERGAEGRLCGTSQATAHFTGRMADLETTNKRKGK
jgi:hypothetical protein